MVDVDDRWSVPTSTLHPAWPRLGLSSFLWGWRYIIHKWSLGRLLICYSNCVKLNRDARAFIHSPRDPVPAPISLTGRTWVQPIGAAPPWTRWMVTKLVSASMAFYRLLIDPCLGLDPRYGPMVVTPLNKVFGEQIYYCVGTSGATTHSTLLQLRNL